MSADLRVDWCSYEAAKYAVEHWHYSKSFRIFPRITIGVWEGNKFVGSIIFAKGANNNLGSPYGLEPLECCELVRVALSPHVSFVSSALSRSIKLLQKNSPGLRLIVSFADKNQGHVGIIYQASNWIYTGETPPATAYVDKGGRVFHQREVSVSGIKPYFGEPRRVAKIADCKRVTIDGKHRYLYPLDRAMRKQIAPLAKPYPKRETCGQGVEGDTSGVQPEGAGSIPADRSDLG